MCHFQVGLNERERPSCVKEGESQKKIVIFAIQIGMTPDTINQGLYQNAFDRIRELLNNGVSYPFNLITHQSLQRRIDIDKDLENVMWHIYLQTIHCFNTNHQNFP